MDQKRILKSRIEAQKGQSSLTDVVHFAIQITGIHDLLCVLLRHVNGEWDDCARFRRVPSQRHQAQ